MTGLAIESATDHVEVAVLGDGEIPLAHEREDVAWGHTRRLTPLVERALERAGVTPGALSWVAADLGPGSFTGVRVGLATAEALALASGAALLGAPSLAALALTAAMTRALVVPLVPAGRRDSYAGLYRADARGRVTQLAAPRVGPLPDLLEAVGEARALLGREAVRFVGPGVAREREALESAWPGGTAHPWRHDGLSAIDLAIAARTPELALLGGPGPGEPPRPLYVRPAQAEERVRREALADDPIALRAFAPGDVAAVAAIEREVFRDPWPESFFRSALAHPLSHARVAVRLGSDGNEAAIVGYSIAWLGGGQGHLDNIAVIPRERRRGVARRLLEDVLERARAAGDATLTLEVRVTNVAAQALYRAYGFRLAALRRGYYRDNREDALVMEWRG